MVGGTFDIWPGIKAKWDAAGLDAAFTALWSGQAATGYLPLQQGQVAQGTPFPYCVVSQDPGSKVVRSSHATEALQTSVIESTFFDFQIYSDSKEEAGTVAALVAAAFDDGEVLITSNSCFLDIQRGQDYCERRDDSVWVWTIPIEVRYER